MMSTLNSSGLQTCNDAVFVTCIKKCFDLLKPVPEYVDKAHLILIRWETEVKTRSEQPVAVFGTELLNAPHKVFLVLQKAVDDRILEVQTLWKEQLCRRLKNHVTRWKTCQLYRWVGRRPENFQDDMQEVEKLCEGVNALLKQLVRCVCSTKFRQVDDLLRNQDQGLGSLRATCSPTSLSRVISIVNEALSLLVMIHEQPPPVLVMESGNKKEPSGSASGCRKANGAQSAKKDKDKPANTKKLLRTTVGILGGSGFGGGVAIRSVTIGLGLNIDLARSRPCTWRPDDLWKIFGTPVDEKGHAPYERSLEDLRLEHFTRTEKDVWQLLYHAVYFVTVVIQDLPGNSSMFQFQVLSFPLMVSTAANQASEHVGAHLWHSFSTHNVYDLSNVVVRSLKIPAVIQMLNERLRGISDRELRDYERAFLREKLKRAIQEKRNGSQLDSITLETFIKTAVTLPHYPGTKMKFSTWRWFHSIINLVQHTLPGPWADGMIHGFLSHQQSLMMLKDQAFGTFFLRFSESYLPDNHILSQGYVSTVVKVEGHAYFIEAIGAEDVKAYGLVCNLENTVCETLLGTGLTVQELMRRYPPTEPNPDRVYIRRTDPVLWKSPQASAGRGRPILPAKRPRTGSDTSSPSTPMSGCAQPVVHPGSSSQSFPKAASPPDQAAGAALSPMDTGSQSPSVQWASLVTSNLLRMPGIEVMKEVPTPSVCQARPPSVTSCLPDDCSLDFSLAFPDTPASPTGITAGLSLSASSVLNGFPRPSNGIASGLVPAPGMAPNNLPGRTTGGQARFRQVLTSSIVPSMPGNPGSSSTIPSSTAPALRGDLARCSSASLPASRSGPAGERERTTTGMSLPAPGNVALSLPRLPVFDQELETSSATGRPTGSPTAVCSISRMSSASTPPQPAESVLLPVQAQCTPSNVKKTRVTSPESSLATSAIHPVPSVSHAAHGATGSPLEAEDAIMSLLYSSARIKKEVVATSSQTLESDNPTMPFVDGVTEGYPVNTGVADLLLDCEGNLGQADLRPDDLLSCSDLSGVLPDITDLSDSEWKLFEQFAEQV